MQMKIRTNKNIPIDYPRHWWFSCSAFTCYLETDEQDNVGYNSSGVAHSFVGESARRFAKKIQRKFGGVMIEEYDKDGKWL